MHCNMTRRLGVHLDATGMVGAESQGSDVSHHGMLVSSEIPRKIGLLQRVLCCLRLAWLPGYLVPSLELRLILIPRRRLQAHPYFKSFRTP